MPRGKGGAGLLEHFIYGYFVGIPLFSVAPVFLCDFPLFLWIILSVLEAFQLGVFIDLHPEFDDDCTPVFEFLFKFIHFIVGTFPVILTAEAFETFYHDPAVPGSVKDCDMTVLGQSCPETPQIMSCLLVGFRACNRMYFITAGVKSFRNTFDVSAFSRCIPAFIGDDDRNPFSV